jgi:hypothetical protein
MAGSGEPHQAGDAGANDLRDRPSETQLRASSGGNEGPTLVTVASAIASGLGVLGFVTFAGGVVLWTRFKQMGLPADHALALVPKSELVVTGAEFLVPAVLLSALILLFTVLVGSFIEGHAKELSRGRLRRCLRKHERLIAPLIVGVGGLLLALTLLVSTVPFTGFLLLVLIAILAAVVIHAQDRRSGDKRSNDKLSRAIFCLLTFLAVGVVVIARTYELTSHDLKVLPMAYSRSQPGEAPRVETGYFVVETSDRILFASQPEGNGSPNELREFPRNETDDLEIGDLARPGQAEEHAARFAYNLCERLAHLRPAPTTSVPSSPTSVVVSASARASSSAGDLLEGSSGGREGRVSWRWRRPPPPRPAPASPVCAPEYVQELANKAGRPWLPQATECRTHLCVTGKLS